MNNKLIILLFVTISNLSSMDFGEVDKKESNKYYLFFDSTEYEKSNSSNIGKLLNNTNVRYTSARKENKILNSEIYLGIGYKWFTYLTNISVSYKFTDQNEDLNSQFDLEVEQLNKINKEVINLLKI